MKKVKKTKYTANAIINGDAIRLSCTNLNQKCSAFEKGYCKMTNAKCVFQIKTFIL